METKKTRAEKFGVLQADAIMEAAHLSYNAPRAQKADKKYKKARYG